MSDVTQAVLYAFENADLATAQPVLVINDHGHVLKSQFSDVNFWSPETEREPASGVYRSIILLAPKQKDETRYLIAWALKALAKDGLLVVAASNDAGGKTLGKILAGFGVEITDISKHKCRVTWTLKPQSASAAILDEAIIKGAIQKREDGLWTQPGLFSWDHLDKGTNALLHYLPFSLAGKGADFGCGIGVIGLKLLDRYKDINKLICLDRDVRALECCKKNLTSFTNRFDVKQADLTKSVDLANLDFIVMNPPFHTGKQQSITMGHAFIINAAKSLKVGGTLIFVANSHLPYEVTLSESFSFHRILNEDHGFKIIEAIK